MLHPFAASRALDTSTLVFVGRTREQQELRTVLAAALGGHGAIALISGEAGIGKTTLAEAVCREAEGQGGLVLVGRCDDLAATPPYGPWIELFAHYPADVQGLTLPSAFTQPGGVILQRQFTLLNTGIVQFQEHHPRLGIAVTRLIDAGKAQECRLADGPAVIGWTPQRHHR